MRTADLADIPAIIKLIRSCAVPEAGWSASALDINACDQQLNWIIRRSDPVFPLEDGSTFAGVSEGREGIDAVILGSLQPVYFCARDLEAVDLLFYAREGADPAGPMRLLDAFEMWAFGCPKVKRIRVSENWITDRGRRVGAVYERRGYEQAGRVYEKELRQ